MNHTISNAFRDATSGAVIIDDQEAYEQARKRKNLAYEREALKDSVSTLKRELDSIKLNLAHLLQDRGIRPNV